MGVNYLLIIGVLILGIILGSIGKLSPKSKEEQRYLLTVLPFM